MRREGAVRSHYIPRAIVHHDVVTDRADVFRTHCRLDRSNCENRRKFSSDSAVRRLASASNSRFSPALRCVREVARHYVPNLLAVARGDRHQ